MKCQNKRKQLLEQEPIIVGTSLYVFPKKCTGRTIQNKGRNKLLLYTE
jgi:hypothetical protein